MMAKQMSFILAQIIIEYQIPQIYNKIHSVKRRIYFPNSPDVKHRNYWFINILI